MYGFLADALVAVHLAYVGTVIVGLLLIIVGIVCRWQWIRNPWFRCIHLAMMLYVAYETVIDTPCPLTVWEQDLRRAAGQDPNYTDSFVGRLMDRVLFYDVSRQDLSLAYYSFAAVIVLTFVLAPPRFRRRKVTPPAAVTVTQPTQPGADAGKAACAGSE
jgi:fucose permease